MSTEVETRSAQMESSQALKTALELSMLNISSNACSPPSSMGGMMNENGDINAMIEDDTCMLPKVPRSQNVTHCVAVPSSEHVAEIVGRQGCKIKALRAKTNTYIKTPVRGEDPVFIITGRPEDVSAAKREVLAAADHFTQIRAAKNAHSNGSRQSPTARSSPDCQEKVTVYVKVPYRVVGLVVGPKGATIKRIQQITNTHIVTPSRDKEPCFEVSGKPEEVEKAKREIESYIAMRTGGCHGDSDNDSDYGSLMSPPMDCIFSPNTRKMSDTTSNRVIPQFSPRSSTSPPSSTTAIYGVDTLDGGFCLPSAWGGAEPSTRSPLSSAVFNCSRVGRSQSFNESTLINDNPPPLSAPIYPMSTVFDFADFQDFGKDDSPSPTTSSSASSEAISSPKSSPQLSMFRRNSCCVCKEKDVVAALVPCGHNLFCAGCARTSVSERCCPVCSSHVTSMLRIYGN